MRNFAIVVGINEYPATANQKVLGGAVEDACDFAEWALDPAGGAVSPADLHFWAYPQPKGKTGDLEAAIAEPTLWRNIGDVKPDPSRGPTAMEIVKTAYNRGRELMVAKANGNPIKARIYVFLAGHGVRAREVDNGPTQTCLLAADFETPNGLTTYGLVPTASFRDGLLTGGFAEVVMFLDCCRVKDPITPMQAINICGAKEPTDPKANWAYANATIDGRLAYEIDVPPVRGAFSHVLLEGLRTERDANNNLCAEGLLGYVVDNIATKTKGQVPTLNYNPEVKPGMVIATGAVAPKPVPPPRELVLNFENAPLGAIYRLVDARSRPVPDQQNIVAVAGTWSIAGLAPSLYGIERVDGSGSLQMFAHPGAPFDVE